jgi:probable transcriptional regulator
MTKKQGTIDALFGSKTRVKLLHLFFNNIERSFFVREITRIVDEQINSVRRELANMKEIGIISSSEKSNKLYYSVNKKFAYYKQFNEIFNNTATEEDTVIEASKENKEPKESKELTKERDLLASDTLTVVMTPLDQLENPIEKTGDNKSNKNEKEKVKAQKEKQLVEDAPLWKKLLGSLQADVVITAGRLVDGSNSEMDLLIVGDKTREDLKVIAKVEKELGLELYYSFLSKVDFIYRLAAADPFLYSVLNEKHEVIVDKDNILSKTA